MSDDSLHGALGARLVDNGYAVLPIMPGTKKPGLFSGGAWRDYPGWPGIAAGRRPSMRSRSGAAGRTPPSASPAVTVIGIDIDIADDASSRAGWSGWRARRSATRRRCASAGAEAAAGLPGGRAGRRPQGAPIEVLGVGRQFVAFGDHPTPGGPTSGRRSRPSSCPLERCRWSMRRRSAPSSSRRTSWCRRRSGRAAAGRARPGRERGAGELRGTSDAVAAALAFIPNDDLDYDAWVRIGMALKGALGEDGRELFAGWSAQSHKDVPETTAKTWASFKPERIGAGTIYHHALAGGWAPRPELVLNGGILVNGRHPARALLERLRVGEDRQRAIRHRPSLARRPTRDVQLDGALAISSTTCCARRSGRSRLLAIGASLCALGALMGRKYRTQTNLRSNLYVVGMADSGSGKDHARGVIKEAFVAAGLQHFLGGNRIASGSGLLTALYRQPSILFQLDEFGQLLGSIVNKRHAPRHITEIWDLLTELCTSAGGTFFGAEYADQKQRPRQDIAQPCCCVHATTVPEPFWAALQEGSMVDGSLARFLVFQTDDDVPDRNRRPKPIGEVPAELVAALQAIAAGVPGHGRGNLAALIEGPMIVPDPYPVPMAPEAERCSMRSTRS